MLSTNTLTQLHLFSEEHWSKVPDLAPDRTTHYQSTSLPHNTNIRDDLVEYPVKESSKQRQGKERKPDEQVRHRDAFTQMPVSRLRNWKRVLKSLPLPSILKPKSLELMSRYSWRRLKLQRRPAQSPRP